ncbi:MAG: hypothetical protein CMN71_01920 [Sphingomonadaceae bacterium]|uniref:hypothetical protein n=1 Tax=Croceicoccus sp. Ery15 TaxID=1703338 RepID=UPI000C3F411A|nr:hypothetical protein [Croceicoccus sp. Ery15]MBL43501.1 hypothetical protein [Sphingomonadaceae bacterium]
MTIISASDFQPHFDRFQELITAESKGHSFINFTEGKIAAWEGYKPTLRQAALARLSPDTWSRESIGSGSIIEHAIDSIEIQDNKANFVNNLVFWQNRFGHANRDHRILLEARTNRSLKHALDALLFDLYRGDRQEGVVFEELAELTGHKYPLIAYLYFLKDMTRFMPIQPTGFDRAFAAMSLGFSTRQQCSWDNYRRFNEILLQLVPLIEAAAGIHNVRPIDAHSFCWIYAHLLKLEAEGSIGQTALGKDAGRVVGGQEKSIIAMRLSIEDTVRKSNGQSIERRIKNKESGHSAQELEALLAELLELQGNRCALTGIPFHFYGPDTDSNLLPSPDRIDSSGHYVRGNIQIVCRFINFWKGASDNEEFKELLMLVRSV